MNPLITGSLTQDIHLITEATHLTETDENLSMLPVDLTRTEEMITMIGTTLTTVITLDLMIILVLQRSQGWIIMIARKACILVAAKVLKLQLIV